MFAWYLKDVNDMDTKTRLCTALILCVLVLTLNVVAVVEEFYAQPSDKVAEIARQSVCLVANWYRPDMYSPLAEYPAAHVPSALSDLKC